MIHWNNKSLVWYAVIDTSLILRNRNWNANAYAGNGKSSFTIYNVCCSIIHTCSSCYSANNGLKPLLDNVSNIIAYTFLHKLVFKTCLLVSVHSAGRLQPTTAMNDGICYLPLQFSDLSKVITNLKGKHKEGLVHAKFRWVSLFMSILSFIMPLQINVA